MEFKDTIALIHPVLAIGFVFPLIGISVYMAWQTRQRRLKGCDQENKTKIPATVGQEHLKVGRWLTGSVVGITLIALAYSIYFKGVFHHLSPEKIPQAIFIIFMFLFTIISLILLYRVKPKQRRWRGIFATLTGIGLIILGCQEGVYRRDFEWQFSHYYYGIASALLMIFSLAIVPDIYKSNRWRMTHIVLNCIALLLFLGQGITGSRDLLEIPLSWQEQHLYQCDWGQKTCPKPPQ